MCHNGISFIILFALLLTSHIWPAELRIEKTDTNDPVIIVGNNCPQRALLYKIKACKARGETYFVDIPHTQAALIDLLINTHGLEHFYSDNGRTRLIQRLDIDIPAPLTCRVEVTIILTQTIEKIPHVLFIKEAAMEPEKLTLPGGMINQGEKIIDAASREITEHLGITVSPRALLLLTILDRCIKDYGITHQEYIYRAPYNGQQIKLNNKIESYQWVPISQLFKNEQDHETSNGEHALKIWQALQNTCSGIPCQRILDIRQQDKAFHLKDSADLMDFYCITPCMPSFVLGQSTNF